MRLAKIHYGTPDGPACGARFFHEGLTGFYNTEDVTCERCKRTAVWRHAERPAQREGLTILP